STGTWMRAGYSPRQQNSQIAYVVAGWTRHDRITQWLEYRMSIEILQRALHIQAALARTLQHRAVSNCACGRTIAINPVGAGAENSDVLADDLCRAVERKLLVTPANAT